MPLPKAKIVSQLCLLPFEISPKQLFKEALKAQMNQRKLFEVLPFNKEIVNDARPFAIHDSLSISVLDNKSDITAALYSLNPSKIYSFSHNDGSISIPLAFPRILKGCFDEKGRKIDSSSNSFMFQVPLLSELVTSYTTGGALREKTLYWKSKIHSHHTVFERYYTDEYMCMYVM